METFTIFQDFIIGKNLIKTKIFSTTNESTFFTFLEENNSRLTARHYVVVTNEFRNFSTSKNLTHVLPSTFKPSDRFHATLQMEVRVPWAGNNTSFTRTIKPTVFNLRDITKEDFEKQMLLVLPFLQEHYQENLFFLHLKEYFVRSIR